MSTIAFTCEVNDQVRIKARAFAFAFVHRNFADHSAFVPFWRACELVERVCAWMSVNFGRDHTVDAQELRCIQYRLLRCVCDEACALRVDGMEWVHTVYERMRDGITINGEPLRVWCERFAVPVGP